MAQKPPFRKPPTSQYRRPEFYWRGGDTYREKEFVADEYKKALAEYRQAEQELKIVQAEVAAASETLSERDGYTTALAGFLDGDTDGFTEEVQLKQELAYVEREIAEYEAELQRRQAIHNPAVSGALQKEKAYYLIEIQRATKAIENAQDESLHAREQLAACVVNNKYRNALQLESQLDKKLRKKKYLRSLVNRTKYAFDSRRPVTVTQTDEARSQRLAMQSGIELKMSIMRAEERVERRRQKHTNQINYLIDQIEELNVRMSEIGLESDCVDTEALRDKYFGNGAEEAQHEEEKKETVEEANKEEEEAQEEAKEE